MNGPLNALTQLVRAGELTLPLASLQAHAGIDATGGDLSSGQWLLTAILQWAALLVGLGSGLELVAVLVYFFFVTL